MALSNNCSVVKQYNESRAYRLSKTEYMAAALALKTLSFSFNLAYMYADFSYLVLQLKHQRRTLTPCLVFCRISKVLRQSVNRARSLVQAALNHFIPGEAFDPMAKLMGLFECSLVFGDYFFIV